MNCKKVDKIYGQELIEAVGYLRLSRDDGEDESTSITNQRAIISDWASKTASSLRIGILMTDIVDILWIDRDLINLKKI